MHYPHPYTSELCCSRWSDFHSSLGWKPNEIDTNSTEMVRDWRGQGINDDAFIPFQGVSQPDVIPRAASLLNVVQYESDELSVDSEFISLCPMEAAFKGTLYAHANALPSNLTGETIVDSSKGRHRIFFSLHSSNLYCPTSF